MDIIQNPDVMPDMQGIEHYISGDARSMWQDLLSHIENEYKSKPKIIYSRCSAKPGWNVKYKKSGKALCTLYPEKEGFVALIVLSDKDMMLFDSNKKQYTQHVQKRYESCTLFNGTKWLMIQVSDNDVLNDIKELIKLKRTVQTMV